MAAVALDVTAPRAIRRGMSIKGAKSDAISAVHARAPLGEAANELPDVPPRIARERVPTRRPAKWLGPIDSYGADQRYLESETNRPSSSVLF